MTVEELLIYGLFAILGGTITGFILDLYVERKERRMNNNDRR